MTAPVIPYEERPYRPCVGIFLINGNGLVFAGRRIDSRAEAWQMPQGGIDLGETPHEACLREMEEEIGTCKATVIHEIEEWLNYDIPIALANGFGTANIKAKSRNGCCCATMVPMPKSILKLPSLNSVNGKWLSPNRLLI